MLSEAIKAEILALPIDELQSLHSLIADTIGKTAMQHRYEHLLALAAIVMGRPINTRSQREIDVWGRCLVSHQLRKDGFSYCQVGEIMGKDHSTIIHMEKCIYNAKRFPRMYRDRVTQLKDFEKAYETYKRTIPGPGKI